MGRFAYGFTSQHRNPAVFGLTGSSMQLGTILPSAAWSGAAGSGFAALPADPVRTTAKPAIRLIVPPRQAYIDELLVGVFAGANDQGSLINTMGLAKVVAHYEGTQVDIPSPSIRTFADANGRPVTYFAWWIRLKHNGVHGQANLYFEAVARDATMQHRVIGPYTFFPAAQVYDHDVEVCASQAELPGARYQTIRNALTYLRSVSAAHPRIRMTEAFTGDLTGPSSSYACPGYCTIEAEQPVLFRKTYEQRGDLRLTFDRIRFQGENITFDMRYIARLRPYNTGNFQFNGVNFIRTGGRDELWNKGDRPAAHIVSYAESGASPWFTECNFDNTANSAMQRAYARGCHFQTVAPDLATGCCLLLDCTIDDMDNSVSRTEIDALTVHYTGTATTATLAFSGTLGSNTRTFFAKVNGVTVGEFVAGGSSSAYLDGSAYDVADVVDWLNTLPGWNAVLLDDTRKAVQLGLANTNGNNFTDADVKSIPLTLVTQFDYHPDIMQRTEIDENVIISGNSGTNIVGQCIFFNVYALKDAVVINNFFSCKGGKSSFYSQIGSKQAHVVIAHNSLSSQGMLLRADLGYDSDAYCLIANNAFQSMTWLGSANGSGAIRNNHLSSGNANLGSATGTTVGGSEGSLYEGASWGNARAAGALLANPRYPLLPFDILYRPRFKSTLLPVGASL